MFFKSKRFWIALLLGGLLAVRVVVYPHITLYDAYQIITQKISAYKASNLYAELINDQAQLFTEEEKQYIGEYHAVLLDRYDLDYRIVTLNEETDISLYALTVFNEHKIGSKSQTNRGLLLVIDTLHDTVRIEVSANLESVFTDSFVSYLEKRQMIQFFKERRVADGIFATSELVRIRAMEAANGEEFDKTQLTGSFGGGAQTKANIGAGKDLSNKEGKPDVFASDDPQETLNRYINALRQRNGRSDLDIFTAESRVFMGTMLSTPAQMDNSVKRLKKCEVERITFSEDNQRAVLFHSLKYRECDPFLFAKGNDGKWRLDLKALGLGVGHTVGNTWYLHFARQKDSGFWKYRFGFKNLRFYRPRGEKGRFDHQGIPYYNTFGMHLNHIAGAMLVSDIQHGGFMDSIGMQDGDMIVEWEGVRFMHTNTMTRRLKEVRPGLDIRILINRQGKMIHKMVKAPSYPKSGQHRFGFSYYSEGFTKKPIVHYVEKGSQADILGLQSGDLIYKWQDMTLPNKGDVYSSIKATKEGAAISAEIYRDAKLIILRSIKQPMRVIGRVH